ncbi:MAG: AI-2E family transporter [Anaerolineales bacterium]
MITPKSTTESPKWGSTLKLVIGLTFVAIIGALLARFRNIVGPLLMAFILAYVLHPLASRLSTATRLSWRAAVNLIYLLMVTSVIAFFTITSVATVQQARSLVDTVRRFVENELPQLVSNLSTQAYKIGPFYVDFTRILGQYDLDALVNQVLGLVQPVLGQAGGVVSALASGTLSTLGWGFFILLVSYFTLADVGRFPDRLAGIEIPGYDADIRRLGRELGHIWNAFMRGQLILFIVTAASAFLLMSILGLRNALALSLLAGAARFVPYVGPFITWAVTGMVAFFQTGNYFGLESFTYSLVVIGGIVLLDQIFDNLVTPRLYGSALGVHPAAVLVAAIVAANLIGFIGLLLAAPVLATLTLFGRYATRKMLDLDPWPESEPEGKIEFPGISTARRWGDKLRPKSEVRRSDEAKTTRT